MALSRPVIVLSGQSTRLRFTHIGFLQHIVVKSTDSKGCTLVESQGAHRHVVTGNNIEGAVLIDSDINRVTRIVGSLLDITVNAGLMFAPSW